MKVDVTLFSGLIALLVVCGTNAGEPAASPCQVDPFPLQQVKLLDGPFKAAAQRDRRYLHDLEADRLLHEFRANAGLPAPGEPMGGWEQTEVRGHTMGHYLSACALTIAACGDEELRKKADGIVAELARCQKALGDRGYLSAFPESFIDRVETGQRVWAPYYTLHKIMAGLLDMYVHTGNRQALEVVTGMANWCKGRCDRLSDEQMQAMLNKTEQGGMNDVLANLYSVTGNADHLALARRFVQQSYNAPLAAQRDELAGQHVNSFIPNMIGPESSSTWSIRFRKNLPRGKSTSRYASRHVPAKSQAGCSGAVRFGANPIDVCIENAHGRSAGGRRKPGFRWSPSRIDCAGVNRTVK